eukprot:CAMPEP_0119312572 /NCGR_PEP_ID=MMETSP1333-20130426/26890_1 /TAXON_ID=418940 /ORGANISM="Scyphosphaera apsteinii, Strain RCC1455" /LENGTH=138 /DNA_ID=CAMNT_0007317215 /DNA_START=40 /DNA_END=456 /DNA_ORIENTATION=+
MTTMDGVGERSQAFLKAAAAQECQQMPSRETLPHVDGLSEFQQSMLDKVSQIHSTPITTKPSGTNRSAEDVASSVNMHKRINPGFVELPWKTSNEEQFKYQAPPDFSKDYMKVPSDANFGLYLDEAIRKHVDLKKTAH